MVVALPTVPALFALGCSIVSPGGRETGPTAQDPTDEAYIWQRAWTDDVREGLVAAAPVFDGFRVQAIAWDVGASVPVALVVDLAALADAGHPVVPVARVEVGAPEGWEHRLADALLDVVTAWRDAGLVVTTVELDHDCPTSQLSTYATRLQRLRERLPRGLELWNTALPTWLDDRRGLDAVRAASDGTILQNHGYAGPDRPLFTGASAVDRTHEWARHRDRPFKVALPAYGARLDGREDMPDAAVVADAYQKLRARPPAPLEGFVWFRMPTAADRRAWPLRTLQAVIDGERPTATWQARPTVPTTQSTTDSTIDSTTMDDGVEPRDLIVVNTGDAPGVAPAILEIRGTCSAADGARGYRALRRDGIWSLESSSPPVVGPGEAVPVGWVRCDAPPRLELR